VLEAAEDCGGETKFAVEGSIEGGAFANDYFVRSIGEPHPVTLRLASGAEELEAAFVSSEASGPLCIPPYSCRSAYNSR
jgi:hypothetical protein